MIRRSTAASALLVLAALVVPRAAGAMPQLARRTGLDCTACHTTIPRLNEFGFEFRKAGFRLASEIGTDIKATVGDTFAARVQARYDVRHHDDAGATTNSNQLTLHEVTLYPLSGAFGSHYGSLMELSIAGEDFVEIENAYFRYARGGAKRFFSGRIGIFHPFEGYGASDRPYSINRPLIQTVAANHNGSTQFTPWNFDEAGLELAYVVNRTSISGTLFNGLFVREDEGAFKAFPAAGGELVKAGGFDRSNSKDFQLFVNQVLKDDGSGLSGYFYYGNIDLPLPGTRAEDFGPGTSFGNGFYRAALYADYRVMPKVELQGGYQIGQDHFFDTAARSANGTFRSQGWFGEVDFPVRPKVTLGGRYDWFDPSTKRSDNGRARLTVFANTPFNNGLQAITEYQHVQQDRAGKTDVKDDNFQVRVIWIF